MIRHFIIPLYLGACLLLGGASAAGYLANAVLQVAAIPLIGWALWHVTTGNATPQTRVPLSLLALLVLIMLVQLIPMPPSLWTILPGRGEVVERYRLIGQSLPWLPLTLAPETALASLLWLLPAIAAFLGVAILGAFRGRALAGVVIAVMIMSVLLGALQVVGGDESSAYLYDITNRGQAVGFFANSNHNATLLLISIPFLGALQAALLKRNASPRSASATRVIVGAVFAIIVVGLLINSSLAGIGLGVPVAMATWAVFARRWAAARRLLAIATAAVCVATLAFIVVGPFGNNLFGQQTANVELSRQTSFALTLRAAGDVFPVGSGVGSFQPIYRTHEPLATVGPTYMNHAHSDWIELLLETGLPGMVLAGLFVFWWCRRARSILTSDEPDFFAQAAIIASGAMMLHSVVDYPLRTAALSAVFAACVGLISGVRPYVRPRKTASSARHLSL